MSELQDLRGLEIGWMLASRRPLRYALTFAPKGRGSLVQDGVKTPIIAELAGVWWQVESENGWETVLFYEKGIPIATSRGIFTVPYTVDIDGWASYRLWLDPANGRITWLDQADKQVVVFRRHSPSTWGRTGEITVLRDALPEHAPVLIILGLIRIARKSVFSKLGVD